MTRNEFHEEVITWDILFDVADDFGLDVLDDLIDVDDLDYDIHRDISEALRDNWGWVRIKEALESIDEMIYSGAHYFSKGLSLFEFHEWTFEEAKNAVEETITSRGLWEEDSLEDFEEEPFSLNELFTSSDKIFAESRA